MDFEDNTSGGVTVRFEHGKAGSFSILDCDVLVGADRPESANATVRASRANGPDNDVITIGELFLNAPVRQAAPSEKLTQGLSCLQITQECFKLKIYLPKAYCAHRSARKDQQRMVLNGTRHIFKDKVTRGNDDGSTRLH